MVQRAVDPLTGADRDDDPDQRRRPAASACASGDARRAPLRDRRLPRPAARRADPPGNLEVHWPEGNVLLAGAPARSGIAASPTTTPSSRLSGRGVTRRVFRQRRCGAVQRRVEARELRGFTAALKCQRVEVCQMNAVEPSELVSFGQFASASSDIRRDLDSHYVDQSLSSARLATANARAVSVRSRRRRAKAARASGYAMMDVATVAPSTRARTVVAASLFDEQLHQAAGIQIDRHRRSSSTMSEVKSLPGRGHALARHPRRLAVPVHLALGNQPMQPCLIRGWRTGTMVAIERPRSVTRSRAPARTRFRWRLRLALRSRMPTVSM